MIEVAEFTVNDTPVAVPKATRVAPVKLLPVIVTVVPPPVGPLPGFIPVTAGALAFCMKLNWLEPPLDVPQGVITVMLTVPVACAGAKAVIELSALTVKLVAGTVPKLTCVAPVRLAPLMVTLVPPPWSPLLGDTPDKDGIAAR